MPYQQVATQVPELFVYRDIALLYNIILADKQTPRSAVLLAAPSRRF